MDTFMGLEVVTPEQIKDEEWVWEDEEGDEE